MANVFSIKLGSGAHVSAEHYDPYKALGVPLEDMRPINQIEADSLEEIAKAAEASLAHTQRGLDAIARADEVVTKTQSLYRAKDVDHHSQINARQVCANLSHARKAGIDKLTQQRLGSAKNVAAHKSLYGI
jgi:type I site-specific restriction endonuclease